ncbi:MAG: hypothetical protein JST12_14490 [Armatimonadetes bacterium]|nr:hypothetical protein [Armatimonadota bacterium]
MLVVDGQIGTDKVGAMKFVGMEDRENFFDTMSREGYFKPVRKNWYLYESLAEGARRAAAKATKGDTITLNVEQGGKDKATKKRGPHGPGGDSVYKTPR